MRFAVHYLARTSAFSPHTPEHPAALTATRSLIASSANGGSQDSLRFFWNFILNWVPNPARQ
jgi:hypothetical protein